MKVFSLFLMLPGLLLVSCAAPSGLPDWVLSSSPDADIPESHWLSAVGSGGTMAEAEKRAIGNLALRFEARVQTLEQLSQETSESAKELRRQTDYRQQVRVEAHELLPQVEFKKRYAATDGTKYVLAAINRRVAAEQCRAVMLEKLERVEQAQTVADSDPLIRYAWLRKALSFLDEARGQALRLQVFDPRSALPDMNFRDIEKRLAESAAGVRFGLELKGPPEIRAAAVRALTGFGFAEAYPALLEVSGSGSVDPVEMQRRDVVFMRYQAELQIRRSGKTSGGLRIEGRAADLSKERVEQRSVNELARKIEVELTAEMRRLLDRLTSAPAR